MYRVAEGWRKHTNLKRESGKQDSEACGVLSFTEVSERWLGGLDHASHELRHEYVRTD